jgi:sec-independent protein translocase protein TatA
MFTPPGGGEWVVILLIVLLFVGGRKLPELGGALGRSMQNFRQGLEEGRTDQASPPDPTTGPDPDDHVR